MNIANQNKPSFVFWRLPESQDDQNSKKKVTLEQLGRSIARTFKHYTEQFPELVGNDYEDIASQFCEYFFLDGFNESITAYFANLSLTDN